VIRRVKHLLLIVYVAALAAASMTIVVLYLNRLIRSLL